MNFIKDRDFQLALFISVILSILFSYIQNLHDLGISSPILKTKLFIIVCSGVFVFLKIIRFIRDIQSVQTKIWLGFVYSLVLGSFSVYVTLGLFYGVPESSNTHFVTFLFWIAIWAIFLLLSSLLLLISPGSRMSKNQQIFMYAPSVITAALMILVTFTFRIIYQPIYDSKNIQLQNSISMKPKKVVLEKNTDNETILVGTLDLLNNVNFDVELSISSSHMSVGICKTNDFFHYDLTKGNQSIKFICDLDSKKALPENPLFTFAFEEYNNELVKMEKEFFFNDFIDQATIDK